MLTNFTGQSHSNFNTVIRGLVQKKQEDLSCQHLMGNLLVAKVCNESGRGDADRLVVSLECFAELNDQPRKQ
jgi:hypothetical protein